MFECKWTTVLLKYINIQVYKTPETIWWRSGVRKTKSQRFNGSRKNCSLEGPCCKLIEKDRFVTLHNCPTTKTSDPAQEPKGGGFTLSLSNYKKTKCKEIKIHALWHKLNINEHLSLLALIQFLPILRKIMYTDCFHVKSSIRSILKTLLEQQSEILERLKRIGKKERSKDEQIYVPPSVRICMSINIFIYFYVLFVPSYFPTSTNYIYFLVYLFSFCNKIHVYPADCC